MVSQIEEVKERTDVADLVGSYIKLDRAGINFKARCPFHNERSASFFVSPQRQIWHCFGCQKGGDVFKFIMEIEGCDFRESLENLAKRAGVELKRESPQIQDEREKYFAIMEEATKFFESHLVLGELNELSSPRAYLHGRGLTEETIREFRLGYALDDWRTLLNHLSAKGFKEVDIEKTGLIIASSNKGQGARYYDRFRGRIIFPIFNHGGKVVAFGGRVFEVPAKVGTPPTTAGAVGAKYINSPETAFYQKSKILYGLHKSKIEILREKACVVVEGYMDFLMGYQAGTKNIVASSGTALTQDHVKILRRLCDKIIAGFDMDEAGESAARRGIELALADGFDIRVLKFDKEFKDPADVVAKDKNLWLSYLQNSRHIVQFYIDSALKKFPAGSSELSREMQKNVLPVVSSLFSDLEQAHWIKEISAILNIKEEVIWSALQKIPNSKSQILNNTEILDPKFQTQTRKELLEQRMLAICAKHPEFLEDKAILADIDFKEKQVTSHFVLEAELFLNTIAEAREEFIKCAWELKKENIKEKMGVLSQRISFAEKNKNEHLPELLIEFKNLSEQINEKKNQKQKN